MKKIHTLIVVFVILGAFFGMFWHALSKATNPAEALYPMTVIVIDLDRENDMVTCIDGADNFWQFSGCEDWEVGDFASFLINDNGTTSIYDDTIEIIRYAGTFN